MLALVDNLVVWHRERYLDPEVWERFLVHTLCPALMPASSELQRRASIEQRPEQLQRVNVIDKFHRCKNCFDSIKVL